MKKRIISLLMAGIMLMSVFTGCGKKGDDKKANVDLEGVTLTVGLPMSANVTSFEDNAFTKYIEDSLNIKLKFVSFTTSESEYSQQLSMMVTGNEKLPDVIWGFMGMSHYTSRQFGEDGYFIDLKDMMKDYAPNYQEQYKKLDEKQQKMIDEKIVNPSNGAIYGMPYLAVETVDNMQNAMKINKTWLDKLGLQIPTTVEELNVVLEAFATKDPNGNGKADELPMLSIASGLTNVSGYLINAYCYHEVTQPFNVTDGKVWDSATSDEYRQGLIYANELCKKGYFSDLCFTLTSSQEFKTMVTPSDNIARVGIWCGNPAIVTSTTSEILDQYVAMDSLEAETDKGGYTVVREENLTPTSFITKDCKSPEAAMRFLDFFYLDETVTRMRFGEKGVDWEYAEGISITGEASKIQVVNGDAFFKGNSTWCVLGNCILTPENYYSIMNDAATPRDKESDRLNQEAWKQMHSDRVNEEVLGTLIYTNEEYEVRSEYWGMYLDYVAEARDLFITGKLDPSSDADWQDYTTTLKNLGQKELLEVAQDAYDRRMGK